jgi:hypothetical protein
MRRSYERGLRMKRVLAVTATVMLALAVPMVVTAATEDEIAADFAATLAALGQPTATPAGGADVAVGNGTATNCPRELCAFRTRTFRFAGASNLHSGAGHGHFHAANVDPVTLEVIRTVSGPIFCVTVNANQATIGFVAERGDLFSAGTTVYVPMVDNGRSGDPTPDLWGPFYAIDVPTEDVEGQCAINPAALVTVVDGDVKVFDGQLTGNN